MDKKRFAVLGAGVSGLVAALELVHRGYRVDLYERNAMVGGLAAPVSFQGKLFDRYYHFLCMEDDHYVKLIEAFGLKKKLHWKATKMGYWFRGGLFPFQTPFHLLRFTPLSLPGRFQYGIGALKVRWRKKWQDLDKLSGKTYLQQTFGSEGYCKLWLPILKAKFDQLHKEVSGAWIWARIHRVATSREKHLWRERYGYLEGGTSTFLGALVKRLPPERVRVLLATPVEKVEPVDNGFVVKAKKLERFYEHVLSTLPLPVLRKTCPFLKPWLAPLVDLTYMGVVAVVFLLNRSLSPFFWLNIVDPHVLFSVLVEYTHLDPRPDLQGSLIYVPYYLPQNHPFFREDPQKVTNQTIESLRRLFPSFHWQQIKASWVFADAFAQPVCGKGFGEKVPGIKTPFKGFYVVESSKLYPRDRTISGQIGLVKKFLALL